MVEGSIRGSALQALFPKDRATEEGWLHRVSYNWETTTLLAGVFAKEACCKSFDQKESATPQREPVEDQRSDPDSVGLDEPWTSDQSTHPEKPLALKYDTSGKAFAEYRLKKDETPLFVCGNPVHRLDTAWWGGPDGKGVDETQPDFECPKDFKTRESGFLKWLAEEYYAGSEQTNSHQMPRKLLPTEKLILTKFMWSWTQVMGVGILVPWPEARKKETGSTKMRWSTTSARGWRDCWKKGDGRP